MQTYMCSPLWYFKLIEPCLMPLMGIQSALCLLLNCIAQTKYKRPYPPIKRFLQFAPCGILWAFTLLPVLLSALEIGSSQQTLHVDYKQHVMHVSIFVLGAIFFALDFPQRFFPGRIDFLGQGHHLFHMCIFFVVMFQINGCYNDYVNNRTLIAASRTAPSFLYCFGSLLAMVFYYIFVIINFNRMVCHNFDDQGNLIKKEKDEELVKQE
jgi:predicted membrane channel-forming protein YqfA (hemolysin III family)